MVTILLIIKIAHTELSCSTFVGHKSTHATLIFEELFYFILFLLWLRFFARTKKIL